MAQSQQEIKDLFKKARRVLKHTGLDILVGPSLATHGTLIVVTSRHVGNAVARNKIRRRMKAIFYEAGLKQKPYAVIAIIKKEGVALSYEQLKAILLPVYTQLLSHVS